MERNIIFAVSFFLDHLPHDVIVTTARWILEAVNHTCEHHISRRSVPLFPSAFQAHHQSIWDPLTTVSRAILRIMAELDGCPPEN